MARPLIKKLAVTLAVSALGVLGILRHEGNESRVYLDPVGVPTVCAGHTATLHRQDVGKAYSQNQCAALLAADTQVAQQAIARLVKVPLSQEQYDALVSFTFNVGGGALAKSTLLARANAGECMAAGAEFPRWNKAKGRVLPGLTKRRAWERSLWESGCP